MTTAACVRAYLTQRSLATFCDNCVFGPLSPRRRLEVCSVAIDLGVALRFERGAGARLIGCQMGLVTCYDPLARASRTLTGANAHPERGAFAWRWRRKVR
jgi:hypothetical protein